MSSLHHVLLDRAGDVHEFETLVVFLADDELQADELSALVDVHVERQLAPDEVVVVVRETARGGVATAIGEDDELEAMRARLGRHAKITVVGFDALGAEAGRQVALGGGEPSALGLAEIARRSVTSIFTERGGFVEANANYHFRNPSGRHTDRFMRLSNILVSSAEISLIAMAALPLLPPDAVTVHVDTPAMFPIVSAMTDHLRSLAPTRRTLKAESFRSYLGVDSHEFDAKLPSAVMISASSSGSMANRIAARGFPADRISHLLFLGDETSGTRCAVNLAFHEPDNPHGITDRRETFVEGSCRLCDDGSIAVPLVGDQFDMGGPEFEPLTVNKTDAPGTLSQTMARLARSGALSISLTAGARRRQYLVRTDRLVKWNRFDERLAYFARRFVPSTVRECIVLDADSSSFAKRLLEHAAVAPRVLGRDEVDRLGRDEKVDDVALDGQPIVIAAAVIESGRALRDVSRDLRRSRPNSPQIYVVGLAKNPTPARRNELERTLVQTKGASEHAFATVEELLLPPSDAPNAWIAERGFLDRLKAMGFPLSTELDQRLATLKKASSPLSDDLFVANDANALALQPGFVFWPTDLPDLRDPAASQADVFYTISSVLQRLRTNPPKPGARALRSNWFQQTRLDPANLGRFNDGVIQASLLRAARPTEIDFSTDDPLRKDAARIVRRIVEASHLPRGEAAAEVLVAIGSRRLRLHHDDLAEVLRERPTHPPLVAELADACRRLLPPKPARPIVATPPEMGTAEPMAQLEDGIT